MAGALPSLDQGNLLLRGRPGDHRGAAQHLAVDGGARVNHLGDVVGQPDVARDGLGGRWMVASHQDQLDPGAPHCGQR